MAEALGLAACLFTYPGAGYVKDIRCFEEATKGRGQDLQARVGRFRRALEPLTPQAREELYTRTFDLNPVCCLEIGWHLFGEHYERGRFLVDMRRTLRGLGLSESGELPDHLSHVLSALGFAEDHGLQALAGMALHAVDRMLACIRGKQNPFEDLLEVVRHILAEGHPETALEVVNG